MVDESAGGLAAATGTVEVDDARSALIRKAAQLTREAAQRAREVAAVTRVPVRDFSHLDHETRYRAAFAGASWAGGRASVTWRLALTTARVSSGRRGRRAERGRRNERQEEAQHG